MQEKYIGCNNDHTPEQTIKRFQFSEVATASRLDWVEKTKWRTFPIRDQGQAGDCVMQTLAKLLGVNNFLEEGLYVECSATDGYEQRANKAIPGCSITDVERIAAIGLTLQIFAPDQKLTEEEANKAINRTPLMRQIAKMLAGKAIVYLNGIDEVASAIATGKGVMMWHKWDYNEYDKEIPTILAGSTLKNHHSTTGLDFGLKGGKRVIAGDDSWGYSRGANGQRFFTEEWFTPERNDIACYVEDLNNLAVVNPTISSVTPYVFTQEIGVGSTGDEVKRLQTTLAIIKDADGYLFPIVDVQALGTFGGITRQAVKRFQVLKGITPVTGYVGPKTIAALNSL